MSTATAAALSVVYGSSPTNFRRARAEIEIIKQAILDVLGRDHPMIVRGRYCLAWREALRRTDKNPGGKPDD